MSLPEQAPEQRRQVIDRRAIVKRGPRFWMDDDELMFELVLDGSTRFGPRPATEADRAEHPDAYQAMLAGEDEESPNPPPARFVDPEVIPPPAAKPLAARRDRAAGE